jgi:hypothetical protein
VEQDDVDDAIGGLDLGALVALEDVLDDQRVQAQGLADVVGLALGRGDEVDPDRRIRPGDELGETVDGLRAFELLGVATDTGRDPDRPGLTGGTRRGWRRTLTPSGMLSGSGGSVRAVLGTGVRSASSSPSEREAGFWGFAAIGVGSSGGPIGRARRGRFARQHSRPVAAPAPERQRRRHGDDHDAGGHQEEADHDGTRPRATPIPPAR